MLGGTTPADDDALPLGAGVALPDGLGAALAEPLADAEPDGFADADALALLDGDALAVVSGRSVVVLSTVRNRNCAGLPIALSRSSLLPARSRANWSLT